MKQPKRRGQVKDFCKDAHRAAFRDQQIQHAIRTAQEAMEEAAAEFERLAAKLGGSAQLLERYRKHEARPRRPKAPAEASPELSQALGHILGSEKK